jgi:amino acid transporter
MSKKIKKISKHLALALVFLLPGMAVLAQTGDVVGNLNLVNSNLPDVIVNIINYLLAFLALLAVIMILFGGFQWLTAGGNEEKVDKAKKILTAAVIGLVIIILAWAIARFVIDMLFNSGQ